MKKKLMSLIMLFATTLSFVSLSGCKKGDSEKEVLVVDGKDVIATINGKNYTADDLYNSYLDYEENLDYLYSKLEELLIKTAVPITESMRSGVVNEVEMWKKEIKENATTNGNDYKQALAEALNEEGVSSEDELIENKLYEIQKQVINNEYWKSHEKEYYENYITTRYVYHVSQILVSVSSSNTNTDDFNVNISSSSTAKKIYDVVAALSDGIPFYEVAQEYSDDSSSASNGGDLGMITLYDSSLSSEVRYALASYSKYFENANISVPEYLDNVYGNGFEVIPQQYIDLLNSENTNGKKLYEDTTYYIDKDSSYLTSSSRNIIFNSLLNTRTFRLLQSNTSANVIEIQNAKMPQEDSSIFASASTQNIIVNDENNPILVVRSDSGIHFISIKKSAFVSREELLKYYSKEVDYEDDYKTYLEKAINTEDKNTKLEKLETLAKEYAYYKISEASISGNEDFINYDMFVYYLNNIDSKKFSLNENIKGLILEYVNNKKVQAQNKINDCFDEAYEIYSNRAEHSNNTLIKKNLPILKCLDGKNCTFTYTDGFKVKTTGGDE